MNSKGAQENLYVFKDSIIQMQEQSIPVLRNTNRCLKRLFWLSREFMMEFQCKKGSIQKQKQGQVTKEKHCINR